MRVNVYSEKGVKTASTIELPKEIFGVEKGEVALRQYIHVYWVNQRQGTASTKTRGEVSGGGRKPWRQKGTGRARQGSIRSPLWPGGGTTHGPKPHEFEAALPQKVRDLALRFALSQKASSDRLRVLSNFALKAPKTAPAAELLNKLELKKTLVVMPEPSEVVSHSFRNIEGTKVTTASQLNASDVVDSGDLLLFKESVGKLKERLEEKKSVMKEEEKARSDKRKVEKIIKRKVVKPKAVSRKTKVARPRTKKRVRK